MDIGWEFKLILCEFEFTHRIIIIYGLQYTVCSQFVQWRLMVEHRVKE